MSSHTPLATTDGHLAQVPAIEGRLTDLARGNDPATTTITNPPLGMLRWNLVSTKRQEKWGGTAWENAEPAGGYAINISGSAASAAAVPWGGVSGKPTTVSGFGITDAARIDANNVWSAKQTFEHTVKMQQVLSKVTIGSGLASNQQFDVLTQGELYFSSNVAANWTLNVRGNSSTPLTSVLAIGESTTIKLMIINGSTPYYCTAFTIDGDAVTPRWVNGSAPVNGIPNCINTYTYKIIRTGSSAYIVLASLDVVNNKYSSKPLAASAIGVADAFKTLPANVPTKVRWNEIYFDDDPSRVPGTTSGIIVIGGSGSDAPTGNIFIRRPGKYRIKAQVYFEPPQTGGEVSAYVAIVHAGTTGTGTEVVAVHNDEIPLGEHPSIAVEKTLKNITPNTYYYINAYYLPTVANNPATLNLQTDPMYCWLEVEYTGEL